MTELQTIKGKLLAPPEGYCRICAVQHDGKMPHNADSLFYQLRFKMRYGRYPTWADAVAHCPEEVKEFFEIELDERGLWTQPPAGVAVIVERIDG